MSFSLGSGNLSVAEPNPTKNNSSNDKGKKKKEEDHLPYSRPHYTFLFESLYDYFYFFFIGKQRLSIFFHIPTLSFLDHIFDYYVSSCMIVCVPYCRTESLTNTYFLFVKLWIISIYQMCMFFVDIQEHVPHTFSQGRIKVRI